MSSSEVDAVVIGAGVVGLACAAEIAVQGRTVCLLERHGKPGLDTSTHNSGVDPRGHLLSAGHAEGEAMRRRQAADVRVLRAARCAPCAVRQTDRRGLRRPATPSELEALYARGIANDVEELSSWSMPTSCARANPTFGPTAGSGLGIDGIVEPEALVRALKHLCDARDVMLVVGSAAVGGRTRRRPAGRSNAAGNASRPPPS